jgi:hypothetical protein
MRPVVLLRASTGSPASPLGLVGRVPPSVKVTPPSVERAKPVNLLLAVALEPESLKPTTTVLPNASKVVSLWVKNWLPLLPALLLVSESAGAGAPSTGPLWSGTSPFCSRARNVS